MPNLSTSGSLGKQRARLVAAREEMDRTIAAMDTVMAYYAGFGKKRLGRPPGVKNALKVGDEKTGVKKSPLTKPYRKKKLPKKPKAVKSVKRIRHMSAEGEARRRAGYFASVERRRKEREESARKEREVGVSRKPPGKAAAA